MPRREQPAGPTTMAATTSGATTEAAEPNKIKMPAVRHTYARSKRAGGGNLYGRVSRTAPKELLAGLSATESKIICREADAARRRSAERRR